MAALGVEQSRWTSALVAGTSGRSRLPARRAFAVRASTKDAPSWAGETPLSSLVNAAINTPWLFKSMQFFAKKVVVDTAEKRGVRWNETLENYKQKSEEVSKIFDEISDPSIEYPSYYTKPFHGYDEGNLNWEAAFEAESATYVMGWRTFKDESMTASEGYDRLRKSITDIVKDYRGEAPVTDILDVGCSVGCSTRFLAKEFPEAKVLGLDLSPYFLAVAEHSKRTSSNAQEAERIDYVQGLAEDTGMADGSFDFASIQFVVHECPAAATIDILTETFRLLRPGGVLAVVENDPKSEVIQNLPPTLFTLMKSTEPWTDQYYTLDFEGAMSDTGYQDIKSTPCDPRHRVLLGRRPQ
ncbi:hypothetical protein BSKO_09726 [Bryopsis sp. KO-2023]|nr:hypothetical protein BSKO_09726 [Bryopsis sp. KO-2023]